MVNTSMLSMTVRKTYSLGKVTGTRPVRQSGQWALKFLLQTVCLKSSIFPLRMMMRKWKDLCLPKQVDWRIFSRKGNCQHTGGNWEVVGEHRLSSNSPNFKHALTHQVSICAAQVPALLTRAWGSLSKLHWCLAIETKSGLLPPLLKPWPAWIVCIYRELMFR